MIKMQAGSSSSMGTANWGAVKVVVEGAGELGIDGERAKEQGIDFLTSTIECVDLFEWLYGSSNLYGSRNK